MKRSIPFILIALTVLFVVIGCSPKEGAATGQALSTAQFASCSHSEVCWQAYSDCVDTKSCQLLYQIDAGQGRGCLEQCLEDAKAATLS